MAVAEGALVPAEDQAAASGAATVEEYCRDVTEGTDLMKDGAADAFLGIVACAKGDTDQRDTAVDRPGLLRTRFDAITTRDRGVIEG